MKTKSTVHRFIKILLSLSLLYSFTSTAICQTFGNVPMGGGGYVTGIITSKTEKNLIYIKTDVGGAYRWDTLENKWIPLVDWASSGEIGYLGVESIALDPENSDNLYLAVGISYFNGGKSAILRSRNKGRTFSVFEVTSSFTFDGNGMGRNTGEKLAVDPNLGSILFTGSRSKGLFKSTDSAAHWTAVSSLNIAGSNVSFVLFDPSTGTKGSATQTIITGVCRTGENLYISTNGGSTFTAISGAPTTLMPMHASLANNRVLYITFANNNGPYNATTGQIWKYDLAGSTWTNITPSGSNGPFCGISVDPNNPDRVIASTINKYMSQPPSDGDRFYLSTNGGTSWVDLVNRGFKYDANGCTWNDFGKIHWAGSIEFDPFNTKRAFVTSGNGLFTCNNVDSAVNVWKFDYKGLEETVPLDIVSIPGGPVVFVIGDYDGSRNTDLNVYGPQLRPSMGTTNSVAFASLNPKVMARAGSSIYISADTGKTWTKAINKGTMGYLAISADGKTIMHSPQNTSDYYRSQDNGVTWTKISGGGSSGERVVADQVNPSVFYSLSLSNRKMMVSFNSGATFFAAADPGAYAIKNIRTAPGKEGHLWVPLQSGGLAHSVDYGSSFKTLSSVSSCGAVGLGKEAPGAEYPSIYIWGMVGGTEGLFVSTDEGATWNRINDNAHEWGGPGNGQFVAGDMNTAGLAYMSTAGRGVVWAKADYLLSSASLNIGVGNSTQLNISVLNGDTLSWTWSSANTATATVDQNGLVTGVALGTAIISATSGTRTLKIAVTVITPLTTFEVTPDKDSIEIAEQIQLNATVNPETTVSWVSANPSVATVSTSGLVTGKKVGRTAIMVKAGNKIIKVPVMVGSEPTGLTITPATDTIKIWEKIKLTANLFPDNVTNKKITWNSENTKVATIDTNGIVQGLSKGTSIISATSVDRIVQASAKIIVSADTSDAIHILTENPEVSVYPNPLSGNKITVDLGATQAKTIVKIIDLNGKALVINTIENRRQFELELNLESGTYLIQLENGKSVIMKKFVIK